VTQLETTWKKLFSLAFGFWMGLTSALFSIIGASRMDMPWQPAFSFWLITMVVTALMIKISWKQALLLLVAFTLASWVAFLVGIIFTGIYVLGSLLVTWALVLVLRLHSYRVLLFATGVLGIGGLTWDFFVASSLRMSMSQSEQAQTGHGKELAIELMVILAMWQTIMMAAIALQLYTERLHRQRLADQAPTEVGPSEP
jgi:hypothetical protein